ncbi:MAG: Flp pilus assembly complex ATPase component TadA [Phycisphaeraceae bacterium]|nr:Flp pilus assembly complex ATPase component TadA [Phycisphaeraceae bacterium]
MELWLYDQSNNTRQTLRVDAEPIVIGRDDSCNVVLKSPFVARKHARIIRKGNQLFVENVGRSGTRVANREVMAGQPMRLDFGDEIQIAQYSIALVRPGAREQSSESGRRAELQAKLMAFEQEVHTELLERMNLRVTGHLNKSDKAYVSQILEHLDQLLSRRITDLDDALLEHGGHVQLHRQVIAEVVRQCQGKVQTDYHPVDERLLDPFHEKSITELVASIVDMMPLLFDATTVTDDLALAEESFDDLFKQTYPTITRELRRYIVRRAVSKDIQDIMLGLGPLQDLLEMANVSEIMVVGKDRIYVEKNGVIQPTTRSFFSDEVLLSIIERIITPVGRRVDHSTPLVDARLADGSRVNVIISPLSLVGPCLTIRKFGWIPFTIDDLIERGSLSEPCAAFLQGCVIGRKNIVISGGTGSGKTTLLNTLSAYARPNERIVTIEESAELRLPQPHVVALEGRPANIEGRGAYTIKDLVRNALRMRPDRVIVGEVRGPEALDMLQAMNTGHDGSLSTLHSNNPADAMQRLETLVLMAVDMPVRAIREQIVSAIDIVVQIARFPAGGRRVTHISEVTEIDRETNQIRLEDIFVLRDPEQPRLRHTGYIPTFAEEMIAKGTIDIGVFL